MRTEEELRLDFRQGWWSPTAIVPKEKKVHLLRDPKGMLRKIEVHKRMQMDVTKTDGLEEQEYGALWVNFQFVLQMEPTRQGRAKPCSHGPRSSDLR